MQALLVAAAAQALLSQQVTRAAAVVAKCSISERGSQQGLPTVEIEALGRC